MLFHIHIYVFGVSFFSYFTISVCRDDVVCMYVCITSGVYIYVDMCVCLCSVVYGFLTFGSASFLAEPGAELGVELGAEPGVVPWLEPGEKAVKKIGLKPRH